MSLKDNGGIESGFVDTTDPTTFTITVIGDNDAPVLDPSGSPVMTPIPRNSTNLPVDTVASLIGTLMTDIDAGAVQGIAIVNSTGYGLPR